ncbi:MAG: alpha-glucan family phosphorylase [Phycisphaerae bacterium]|nr:alpha-glucan family phosphorylase [Phycisphaerae bacterium]
MEPQPKVAYFSMEIGLDPAIPTYRGDLGMLAGDSLRAAADLRLPMIAVTLVHRRGYFYQRLDAEGVQTEEPVDWALDDYLKPLEPRATVTLEGRPVQIAAWQFDIVGAAGFTVPVVLLDTDLPENAEGDRAITHYRYGGDARYRLLQEVVLGVGGLRMLRSLGLNDFHRYHMNEGHAALSVLELLKEETGARRAAAADQSVVDAVRRTCVFTTHTPVEAGHDKFPMDPVQSILKFGLVQTLASAKGQNALCCDGLLNMTFLGWDGERIRRPGDGRKQIEQSHPEILDDLKKLVEDETAGDPSSADRWVNRSSRKLAAAMKKLGHNISHVSVIRLLKNWIESESKSQTFHGSAPS